MKITQYRKKPVVIEAFQMTLERRQSNAEWPGWLHEAWNKDPNEAGSVSPRDYPNSEGSDPLIIRTLEGMMSVEWGDWIIKGVKGELYPCKPDIFEATYEAAGDKVSGLNFGEAIAALEQGERIARIGWNGKGLFIFRQVPSEIPADVIPRMQSLPDSVKTEFARRGRDISYANQLAIVKPNNEINGWAPSVADALATDWLILSD